MPNTECAGHDTCYMCMRQDLNIRLIAVIANSMASVITMVMVITRRVRFQDSPASLQAIKGPGPVDIEQ